MQKRVSGVNVWVLCVLSFLVLPAVASAQYPSPANWVRFLDVRCYDIPNQPPIDVPLRLDHLNPYFQSLGLPHEDVKLREAQQLCVPVVKNNFFPPDDVRRILRWLDWKCYGIEGPSLDLELRLDQLNPVIRNLFGPEVKVIVREPEQLCVPVAKNQNFPPSGALGLVQWLDVKCYRVESPQIVAGQIQLTHLNPLFAGLPPEVVQFVQGSSPVQLCVPVAKDQNYPPHDVYQQIAYSDVLCYQIRGSALNWNLRLDHLNPVLRAMGLPPEFVFVGDTEELCVPVAKEGWFPPV
jgi:hypothetical protein